MSKVTKVIEFDPEIGMRLHRLDERYLQHAKDDPIHYKVREIDNHLVNRYIEAIRVLSLVEAEIERIFDQDEIE